MNQLLILILSSIGFINAQVYDGYTLFTPMSAFDNSATTYLMNNDYEFLNTWTHDQGPASMPYLLTDGSIIYPYRVPFPTMSAGGVGGGIQNNHGMVKFSGNMNLQMSNINTIMMWSPCQMEIF